MEKDNKEVNNDIPQNLFRGDEDKDSKNKKSIILLTVIAIVISVSLFFSVYSAINPNYTPEEIQANRDNYCKSYDESVKKQNKGKIHFLPSSFKDNTFIIAVDIGEAAFTFKNEVVKPKWLVENKKEKIAQDLCKDAKKKISNKSININSVEYQYYYDNTRQYSIYVNEENCKEI